MKENNPNTGEIVSVNIIPSMPIASILKRPTINRERPLSDKEVERKDIICHILIGDFEALYPLLERINGLTPAEISYVITHWIQNGMPGNAQLYSEALTFGDLDRIKLTDAVLAKKYKER